MSKVKRIWHPDPSNPSATYIGILEPELVRVLDEVFPTVTTKTVMKAARRLMEMCNDNK